MAFSKCSQVMGLSTPLKVQEKTSKFSSDKCLYAIIVIKFDFLTHLHLLGPSGDVEKLWFQHLLRGPADVNA